MQHSGKQNWKNQQAFCPALSICLRRLDVCSHPAAVQKNGISSMGKCRNCIKDVNNQMTLNDSFTGRRENDNLLKKTNNVLLL